ncbi:serine/threonine-protein kinase PKH2 [Galendromus occidentalis]|uniref:Serine/threonine-protein kinase PKH2 n=1 Tax=Galendromus occidentalis TaxID=34638 RepID=A0AAJ7WJG8_9ACAR|nr:serine/threonine-protein kinase PKH2 [Galendromus occidentalis]
MPVVDKSREKTAALLITLFKKLKKESPESMNPMQYYCREQILLTTQTMLRGINKDKPKAEMEIMGSLTENLVLLHLRVLQQSPVAGSWMAGKLFTFVTILADMADKDEDEDEDDDDEPELIDWNRLADHMEAAAAKFKIEKWDMKDFIPSLESLKGDRLLGQGGFGRTYLGRYLPKDFEVCIKVVPLEKFQLLRHACADKLVACMTRCVFIVQYFAVFQCQNAHITLMEHVRGADLNQLIKVSRKLEPETVRGLAAQLYIALEYLHLHGFIHRDMKTANILVTAKGFLKLIDFDTSKVCLAHNIRARLMKCYFQRTAGEFSDKEKAGTLAYRSPEAIQRHHYGRALDWWAIGCVIFKLTTGKLPFRGQDLQLREKILHDAPDWPEKPAVSRDLKVFIIGLLDKDPHKRLGSGSYAELRHHEYFKDVDFAALVKSKGNETFAEMPKEFYVAETFIAKTGRKKKTDKKLLELDECEDADKSPKSLLTYVSASFAGLVAEERDLDPPKPEKVLEEELLLYTEKLACRCEEPTTKLDMQMLEVLNNNGSSPGRHARDKSVPGPSKATCKSHKTLLKSSDWNEHAALMQLTLVREATTCAPKFGFCVRVIEGDYGAYGFVHDIKAHSKALAGGLLFGDIIHTVNKIRITANNEHHIRQDIRDAAKLTLTVVLKNPFRYVQLNKDIFSAYGITDNSEVFLKVQCKASPLKDKHGFKLKTFLYSDEYSTYAIHLVTSVDKNFKIQEDSDAKLYVGDVLFSVNGQRTTRFHTYDQVSVLIKKSCKKHLLIGILPISPYREDNEDKEICKSC